MSYIRLIPVYLLVTAAFVISSCSDASLVDPQKPQWGVGGELVFDSYSVDPGSGFWRNDPDSTVRYRFVDDKAAKHGRTNVRVFVSSRDSILIAYLPNGDAEIFLNRFAIPLLPLPKLWAPLPFVSKRDATFMSIDSTIGSGQLSVVLKGNAISHYAGNEEFSAPGIDRMTTSRTEVIATGVARVAGAIVASLDMEGTVWHVPANDIITRSDYKMDVLMYGSTDKVKSGTSLRLKEIVYPQ